MASGIGTLTHANDSDSMLKGSAGCMMAAGNDPSSSDADNLNAVLGRLPLLTQCPAGQSEPYAGVIGTLALADPGRPVRISMLEMFLTGASAALLAGPATFAVGPNEAALSVTALLVASVLCPVLGVRVVRGRRSRHGRARSGALAGLWFGSGLMVGDYVTRSLHFGPTGCCRSRWTCSPSCSSRPCPPCGGPRA